MIKFRIYLDKDVLFRYAHARLNGDGTLDVFNLVLVGSHFGESTIRFNAEFHDESEVVEQ